MTEWSVLTDALCDYFDSGDGFLYSVASVRARDKKFTRYLFLRLQRERDMGVSLS